jgi:N-acetylhexosamine 1-kinase
MTIAVDLLEVCDEFAIEGTVLECRPFGSGHLHKTYVVRTDVKQQEFILQKINTAIFSPVETLMGNIEQVLLLLHHQNAVLFNPEWEILKVPTLVPTKSGALWLDYKKEPSCWRLYTKVKNAKSFEIPPTLKHVASAAGLVGTFLSALQAPHSLKLTDVLPHFQNISRRVSDLEQSYRADLKKRRSSCAGEYEAIMKLRSVIDGVWKGATTQIVVHNDLKFNNVLFDVNTEKACSVIDFDTCAKGSFFYDFGDFLRSSCATAAEEDVENIDVDLERLEQGAHYFLVGYTHDRLTRSEREQCCVAPAVVAAALAARFLSDYLNGDNYFAVKHSQHNLLRAQGQLKLAEIFLGERNILKNILL